MKKISVLALAALIAVLFVVTTAFAEQGNFTPPKYDKSKGESNVVYVFPQINNHHTPDKAVAEEMRAAGYFYVTVTRYRVDTDGDGRVDLWHVDYDMPAHEAQDIRGLITKMPPAQTTILYVGVNADESDCERILYDLVDKNGKPGRDGIYEKETVSPKPEKPEK